MKSSYLFVLVVSLVLCLTGQIPDILPEGMRTPFAVHCSNSLFLYTLMFFVISSSPGVTCECQNSSQVCTYWVASLSPYVAFLMGFPCFFLCPLFGIPATLFSGSEVCSTGLHCWKFDLLVKWNINLLYFYQLQRVFPFNVQCLVA